MTHYFKNKEGNKMIGVDGGRVTEYEMMFTNGVDEVFDDELIGNVMTPRKEVTGLKDIKVVVTKASPKKKYSNTELTDEEKRAKKQAYMKEYNKNYNKNKKDVVKRAIDKTVGEKRESVQVLPEPNMKLINEFGKHVVDNIILCKRQGYTAEEIDDDKPAHCGHLVFGQIERILEEVKA